LDKIADIVTIDAKAAVQVAYAVLPGMVQKYADYSKNGARLTSR
jgi:hypothetical protein